MKNLLFQNTVRMLVGQGARTLIQGVYFVIIVRVLGTQGYGAFVGAVALVAIVAPFASLGSGNVLIREVSRDAGCFRASWGRALGTTLVSGSALMLLVALGAGFLLPASFPRILVIYIALADLLFVRLLDVSSQAYQAFERLDRTVQLQFSLSPLRLMAAIGLSVGISSPTALEWASLYLLTAALAGCGAVALAGHELGWPRHFGRPRVAELREGFYFSVSLAAQGIYNDIDKALLVRLSTLEATGIYAAAYRCIDLAFVPVRSLLYASYARFFQHGARGIAATTRFARRLLGGALAYSALAGVALFTMAPLIPNLLGQEYRGTVEAVRWLAFLPLLKTLHYLGADALTGAGYQGIRTSLQLAVAVLNVVLCLWLIRRYSWHGAAWASLASDGALAMVVWGTAVRLRRLERSALPLVVVGPSA